MKKVIAIILVVTSLLMFGLTGCVNTEELDLVKSDLQTQITALESITATDEELESAVSTAKAELQAQLHALNQTYATDEELASAIDIAKSALTEQTNIIKLALETTIADLKTELQGKIDTLATTTAQKDSELEQAIKTAKETLEVQIIALNTAHDADIETLVNSINTAKAELTTQINAVKTALEKAVADLKTELQGKIDMLTNTTAEKDSELEQAIKTAKETLEAQISALETAHNSDISQLANYIDEAKENIEQFFGQIEEKVQQAIANSIKISEDGFWIVNGVKTEYKAIADDGKEGNSAYEIYKEKYGYEGTEAEWIDDLVNGKLSSPKTYRVIIDYKDNSEPVVQYLEQGERIKRPQDPVREGYVFKGWYCFDGVEYEKWSFSGYGVFGDITLEAKWEYATLELPIVNINTNGESITSKIDYVEMDFSIENCDYSLKEVAGGIRLRGNSTLTYSKKPYRIKFDKKQSLFGLTKAKSWVLLADYLDPSGLHNYTAMSIAQDLPGLSFTTTAHKVNVYLNGEFKGLYTLCEQVQENEGRMNIEMDEITEDMTELKDFNFFISMDKSVISDKDAILNETYYYIEEYDRYFELKYPEKSDFCSEEQFESFFNQLVEYTKNILDSFANKDVQTILEEVNVNSLADYLIIDQIMGELDHASKSFNMYYTNTSSEEENGKLNFGPIWDYDWSLFTQFTGKPNEQYSSYTGTTNVRISNNPFYQSFYSIPEFLSLVKERYNFYAAPALQKYLEDFDGIVESISESIELNRQLWYSDLDVEISNKNIAFLKEFLESRVELLGRVWKIDN